MSIGSGAMGVPGFNTWMRSQYLGAYVPQRSEFDHVYVDMASILHTVLRKGAAPATCRSSRAQPPRRGGAPGLASPLPSVSPDSAAASAVCLASRSRWPSWCVLWTAWSLTWCISSAVRTLNRFHVSLYTHLDEVLRRTQPRKSVVFALDGPAPLAKLLTQRCGPEGSNCLAASRLCGRVAAPCRPLCGGRPAVLSNGGRAGAPVEQTSVCRVTAASASCKVLLLPGQLALRQHQPFPRPELCALQAAAAAGVAARGQGKVIPAAIVAGAHSGDAAHGAAALVRARAVLS